MTVEPLTPDRERWAEALAVHRQHGDDAMQFVNGRIADLAVKDDRLGVDRWMAISARLKQLLSGPRQ